MSDTEGLVVIVGAGPGIASSVGRTFATEGYPLLLVARNPTRLAQHARRLRECGTDVAAVAADASRPDSVADVIAEIRSPMAALVYNAAGFGGPLLGVDPGELRSIMEVNLHTPVAAVRAALPNLKSTHGSVLITGGGLATRPESEHGATSVGKSALRTASFVLAQELQEHDIRLITVTVTGRVCRGSAFDPEEIAMMYLKAHQGLLLGPEIVI